MAEQNEKLELWQRRLKASETAYSGEVAKMDGREKLYAGVPAKIPLVKDEVDADCPHIRNIVAELIESQVDSNIPQPKVTPLRAEDEGKAKLVEDMLRNELDRMPFEQMNDMMSRTVPIQGGAGFLVEWDNTQRTHKTIGELSVSVIHPMMLMPQDGVYSGIEDMDYIILKLPQTKEYIRRKYGKDVSDEAESAPEVKGGSGSASEEMVTQYIGYYRNDEGGIGLYSWVNDVELEDLDDYQARRLERCKVCGAVKEDETCRCGAEEWSAGGEEYEEVFLPITRGDGMVIPGAMTVPVFDEFGQMVLDETGLPLTAEQPTLIPYYKPNIYPVILQKNVSVHGKFLGDSDVDKIADQQNSTNRLERKVIEKLLKSGSYITLPDEASIEVSDEDMKIIRPGNAASKQLIDVFDMAGNVEQDMAYLAQIYEEARQIIGITDSFQGRKDTTATSGKAKEFAAAQSAGRLESKRVMKNAAYAALFEALFKFKLAYADEPREVITKDLNGNTQYEVFNRYDFLERDENGEWYWNDRFLFSCDTSAPLANNREAMWQETRMNLQTGAFGDPTSLNTLIMFWNKMEMLHYPGASETKAELEQERARQEMMQRQQMMMQQQMAQQQQDMNVRSTIERARQDAAQAALKASKQPLPTSGGR